MTKRLKKGFDIEDVLPAIIMDLEDAVDFIDSEFSEDIERSDRYYNGEVDILVEEGRTRAVATVVRDAVRSMRPSIMRVLCSNHEALFQYVPSNISVAAIIEQQQLYVHQLFWANGGYVMLHDAVDETLKHRYCAVKTHWDAAPAPEFERRSGMTVEEVMWLSEQEGVTILEADIVTSPYEGETPPEIDVYTVEYEIAKPAGRIVTEAIPYGEFFISRNARTVKDSRVHGHRRSVTVAEAIEMGLDYDDWEDLDDYDPETAEVMGASEARRGYMKEEEEERGDVLSHRFLLTEAYAQVDLLDLGYNQLYVVFLGGTSYELLGYEREVESPFDVIAHDPRAFTVVGNSIADITMPQQDVQTSLLRGLIDNVHASNNPRLSGNPQHVNFQDLMNFKFGHPIRNRGNAPVQVVSIPSQVQGVLPMLQWLERGTENSVGVTKAAQGLDPDAMQSTDKDAVQNTIQLSQGQVELAVRNIIETGLLGVFRKMLRLSISYMDKMQVVTSQGALLPVNQLYFNADLYAQPQVGIGSVPEETRKIGLTATLQQQMQLFERMGPGNPFVGATHIYNTLEDLTKAYGLKNVSRYFNKVTPEIEKAYAEQKRKEAEAMEGAKRGNTSDPTLAFMKSEEMKAQIEGAKLIQDGRLKTIDLQFKTMTAEADDDFRRDELAQKRVIELAKIATTTATKVDDNVIKREQAAARPKVASGGAS